MAFLGQMMAAGTRPAGVSVQVLPSASEPLEPHTINTTISVPIAATMPISGPYFRISSSPDAGARDRHNSRGYAHTALSTQAEAGRPCPRHELVRNGGKARQSALGTRAQAISSRHRATQAAHAHPAARPATNEAGNSRYKLCP